MTRILLLAGILAVALSGAGCWTITIGGGDGGSGSPPPPSEFSANAPPPPAVTQDPTPAAVASDSAPPAPPPAGEQEGGLMGLLRGVARTAAEITLGAKHGAIFYGYDTLAHPGEPITLTARLQKAENLKAVAGATVGFYRGEALHAEATIDADGFASTPFTPPAVGDYEFAVKILTLPAEADPDMLNAAPAPLLVASRDKQVPIIVVDLDYTVVGTGFHTVLLGQAKPMAGSQEVLTELARHYTIVYLTHRPDLLARRSRSWLNQYQYPSGPLLVSDIQSAFGDSGKFKTAKLAEMRQVFPNVKIGIGDKLSDAQSYADNGLTAYLIPHYDAGDAKKMRQMARDIRRLRGDIHVVRTWQQIREGILEGKGFPAAAFADWLDRQAAAVDERDD